MTETGDRCAARGIEIEPALGIDDPEPLASHGLGQLMIELAMEYAADRSRGDSVAVHVEILLLAVIRPRQSSRRSEFQSRIGCRRRIGRAGGNLFHSLQAIEIAGRS